MKSNETLVREFKYHFAVIVACLIPTVLFLSLGVLTIFTSPDYPGFICFCLIVGALCGAVSRHLYFSQSGLDLDAHQGKIIKWSRSGGARKDDVIHLDEFEMVEISAESVTNYHTEVFTSSQQGSQRVSTATVYSVGLLDSLGGRRKFMDCHSYIAARRYGELIAKAAKLDLKDASTSPAVVRAYDKLDESLGQRLKSEGVEIEMSEPPEGLAIEFLPAQRKTLISLPPEGLIKMVGAFIALFLGLPLVIFVVGFSRGNSTAFLVTAGPLLLFSGITIWHALIPRRLEVDGDSLSFLRQGGLRRNLGRMRLSELEEIIVGADRVTCRGDSKDMVIHIKSKQAAWLRKAIKKEALDRASQPSA